MCIIKSKEFIFSSQSNTPVTNKVCPVPWYSNPKNIVSPSGSGSSSGLAFLPSKRPQDPQYSDSDSDRDSDIVIETSLIVVHPKLWSTETPYVYTLVISLIDTTSGDILQSESTRVGFRDVTVSQGLLKVNQSSILVKGVNYHEHDPVLGHTIPPQLLESDIILMKRNNFNSIRTSHYPQASWFYELCTLYGMFVVDEANIETHGMKPYIGR